MSEQVVVDMVLPVDRHGDVNLQAWTSAVDNDNDMAVQWWNGVVLGHDRWYSECFHVCSLLSMVSGAIEKYQCKALWRQLVWQLARRIEGQGQHARSHGNQNSALQVETASLSDLLDNTYQLEKHLAKYIESGKLAIGVGTHWLSFMHDIGNCSGVRLDAGAFITATDQAIISVPKAFCFCLLYFPFLVEVMVLFFGDVSA